MRLGWVVYGGRTAARQVREREPFSANLFAPLLQRPNHNLFLGNLLQHLLPDSKMLIDQQ
jgi:hypothetical protein